VNPSATSTRIVLVRHGQVAEEWRDRLYGGHDVPLSPTGEEEAARAAALLAPEPFDAVISSTLSRAIFGAARIAATRPLDPRAEADLCELERGEWRGLRRDEVPGGDWERWLRAPGRQRAPGGESLTDLAARVLPRLDALAREFAGGSIVIVAHSWVIRVALCEALALDLDLAPRLGVRTGGVTLLEWPVAERTIERCGRAIVLGGLGTDRLPALNAAWYRGPRREEDSE
jgi:broad specificity phosphatase PhoE